MVWKTAGSPKIAIIQPASFGDNINSTLMLSPIKNKFPNARIDVYTTTIFGSAFYNNHLIDNLIMLPALNKKQAIALLETITTVQPYTSNQYDLTINAHPMINPGNWSSLNHPELGTNIIYAWVRALELNSIDYDLPLETHLTLTAEEVAKVDRYCDGIVGFANMPKNIMEIYGQSNQSFWNPVWTKAIVSKLCSQHEIVFISGHRFTDHIQELLNKYPRHAFYVGDLSIRECAELFNRCQRFFSCSSGLSNACNTNWCKKDIVWIETVNSLAVSSAPIRSTGKVFWTDNNLEKFLETITKL